MSFRQLSSRLKVMMMMGKERPTKRAKKITVS